MLYVSKYYLILYFKYDALKVKIKVLIQNIFNIDLNKKANIF